MNPRRHYDKRRLVRPFLRWIVPSLVILLAVAGSGDSSGSGPTTSTGAQVTKSVPFVRESIDEIRALGPFREQTVPENRADPLSSNSAALRCDRRSGVSVGGTNAFGPIPPFVSRPPGAGARQQFRGAWQPPHSQGDVIPPTRWERRGQTIS